MAEMLTLGVQFGIAGFTLAFFMYWWKKQQERDQKREEASARIESKREEERIVREKEMTTRIQQTEDWIRNHLMTALDNNTAAFREFAGALREVIANTREESRS
jgi:Flp pilus assembly protein TadB